ncbi:MAG: PAS domain-containing protein, partial [Anaerolineae bacterium]|nr:PAS domain-containing protein [Anaerolineae bacterium]
MMGKPNNILHIYTQVLRTQNIGYLLLDKNLIVLTGNLPFDYDGKNKKKALEGLYLLKLFPEFLKYEEKLSRLCKFSSDYLEPETIQRKSSDGIDHYFTVVIKACEGTEQSLLCTFTDITRQVKLEQELLYEQSRHRVHEGIIYSQNYSNHKNRDLTIQLQQVKDPIKYRTQQLQILNAIPDLILCVNKDGTFLDFKLSEEVNLPADPSELIGKSIIDVMPSSVAQQTLQAIEQTLTTGDIQRFEYQMVTQDVIYDYEARTSAIDNDEVLIIIRDISQRKRVEKDRYQYIERLQILHEIDRAVLKAQSSEAIAQATLQQIRQLVPICSR